MPQDGTLLEEGGGAGVLWAGRWFWGRAPCICLDENRLAAACQDPVACMARAAPWRPAVMASTVVPIGSRGSSMAGALCWDRGGMPGLSRCAVRAPM
eukprot:7642131-Heterocapsa_arctica.AAC.1